jgi:hypothetical protein
VDFVEKITVQLADPVSRPTVFTSEHLKRVLSVCYRTDEMPVSGPFTAVFDEFGFGFLPSLSSMLEGWIGIPATTGSNPISLRLDGLGQATSTQPDAIWRGSIIARSTPSYSPIENVEFTWLLDDIDAEILAALGSMPPQPQLEAERRTRFLNHFKAASIEPALVTEASLDVWLAQVGAESVSQYLESQRPGVTVGVTQIAFAAAPAGQPTPKPLPIACALLIRGATQSIRALLNESASVRKSLASSGIEMPDEPLSKRRFKFAVGWVLPKSIFADTDWPGANATDRENRAAGWLADQGIALIAI